MKCLTLTQPWATLVATGDKRIETRSWGTPYRGPLAIHAAKGMPDWAIEFAVTSPAVQTMLQRAGVYSLDDLPRGAVIATCQIVACRSTNALDIAALGKDRILGDFSPGRYAWYLEDVMRVDPPRPARGALGLWEFDADAAGVEVVVTGRLFA